MFTKYISGVLFIAIGFVFYILSGSYDFGTIHSMGPGFFPRVVSILLMLVGIISIFMRNKND